MYLNKPIRESQFSIHNFELQFKKTGLESIFFAGLAATAKTFLKNYAAPLIGFAVGFFFLRFIYNLFFKPNQSPIIENSIEKCKNFEREYRWLAPSIMLVAVVYLSPKCAESKWFRNLAFWTGASCGTFMGITYKSQAN